MKKDKRGDYYTNDILDLLNNFSIEKYLYG